MRIGIQLGMHGHRGRRSLPPPRWENMAEQIRLAEEVGFDLCVLEDAIVSGGLGTHGFWEAMTLAGAAAAITSRIEIGHSVVNPPLRPPAVVANAARTLDEISGGRYVLGIGAGNAPDDYEAFGIAADPRYGRATEWIEIVHGLLRTERVDLDGVHHQAHGSLALPGPRPDGPPIIIGARGPKMARIAVRFGDGWNTWSPDPQTLESFAPLVARVDEACEELGRDPATLRRTIDISVDPHALIGEDPTGITPYLVNGSSADIADQLLAFGTLGIDEVRVMIWPDRPAELKPPIVEALADVVAAVHAG